MTEFVAGLLRMMGSIDWRALIGMISLNFVKILLNDLLPGIVVTVIMPPQLPEFPSESLFVMVECFVCFSTWIRS